MVSVNAVSPNFNGKVKSNVAKKLARETFDGLTSTKEVGAFGKMFSKVDYKQPEKLVQDSKVGKKLNIKG